MRHTHQKAGKVDKGNGTCSWKSACAVPLLPSVLIDVVDLPAMLLYFVTATFYRTISVDSSLGKDLLAE